jgi:two-component system sensor histidine kinase DesK
MSGAASESAGRSWLTARQAGWLLIALHVPMAAVPAVFTGTGLLDLPGRNPVLAVLLGLVAAGLQLRHSLAAARNTRPRHWGWTFLTLVAVVYLPWWLLGWWSLWEGAQMFAMASSLMLLRGRPRVVVCGVMVLLIVGSELGASSLTSVSDAMFAVCYSLTALVPSVILYLATRLVLVLSEVEAAHAELAEAAVGRERLRLARDLHDLFGQSLSAISLKGDLALRLLRTDPPAARDEVLGLTTLARDTLRTMRAVTRDEHAVSLRTEADGAAALLGTAGVHTVIDLESNLSLATQQIFAWAVREGVTNVLRHSEAETCSITVTRLPAAARLEIVNDRPRARPATDGRGLAGLTTRAEALGGSTTAGVTGDEFRLVVEVPEREAR